MSTDDTDALPDRAYRMDDGAIELLLARPLKIGGEERRSLIFRPLAVGDLMAQDEEEGEMAKKGVLIARATGVDLPIIKKCAAADWRDMMRIVLLQLAERPEV